MCRRFHTRRTQRLGRRSIFWSFWDRGDLIDRDGLSLFSGDGNGVVYWVGMLSLGIVSILGGEVPSKIGVIVGVVVVVVSSWRGMGVCVVVIAVGVASSLIIIVRVAINLEVGLLRGTGELLGVVGAGVKGGGKGVGCG